MAMARRTGLMQMCPTPMDFESIDEALKTDFEDLTWYAEQSGFTGGALPTSVPLSLIHI